MPIGRQSNPFQKQIDEKRRQEREKFFADEIARNISWMEVLMAYYVDENKKIPFAIGVVGEIDFGMYIAGRVDLWMKQAGSEKIENKRHPWFPLVVKMLKEKKSREVSEEDQKKFAIPAPPKEGE